MGCQRVQRALRHGLSCDFADVLYFVCLIPPPSDRSDPLQLPRHLYTLCALDLVELAQHTTSCWHTRGQ